MLVLAGDRSSVGQTTALAYSPDGRTLASCGQDGVLRLWDLGTGKEKWVSRSGIYSQALAFSRDGQLVAAGNFDTTFVWHSDTGQMVSHLPRVMGQDHPGALVGLAFRSDSATLVGAFQRGIGEWTLATGQFVPLRVNGPTYAVPQFQCLAISPGRFLAAGDLNHVSMWLDGEPVRELHWPNGYIRALAFSPNGENLAVARRRDVSLWNLQTRRRVQSLPRHQEEVRGVGFSGDGRLLVTAGDDWSVHLWDLATGRTIHSYNWRVGEVIALAVAPDGMTAAIAGARKPGVVIFDLEW